MTYQDHLEVTLAAKSPRRFLSWTRLKPYFAVSNFFFWVATLLFGPIPILSLLRKIWHINLAYLPQYVLLEYERLRDAALLPLAHWLQQFSIPLPTIVGDIFTIYAVLAASVVRGTMINRGIDRARYARDPDGVREELRAAAEKHIIPPKDLIDRFEYGLKPGFRPWLYFQFRAWRSGIRWPIVVSRNLKQLLSGKGVELALGLLTVWALAIVAACLGTFLYIFASAIARG